MSETPVVIVSGGSRGLGAALCSSLLDDDFRVATFSRKKGPLNRKYEGHPNLWWESVDMMDEASIKAFVIDVARRWRRVDGLVNNAGATLDQLLALTTDEEMDRTVEVNLMAAMRLTRAAVRIMVPGGSGSIVNVSSVLGRRGFKGTAVYGATKAALEGFSRSLARELGPRHIRVNTVSPGFIETDMTADMAGSHREQILRRTPMRRMGEPEDVVAAIRFLLSDGARFVTGQTLVVDGGLTC